MKLRNFYSCALMAGAVATFASCAGDDLANDNAAPSREVSMTVKITRNAVLTRTTLDELDGNLESHWEEGDCVLVTDEKGGKLGVLTILSGAGTSEGQFNGTLTVTGSGEQTYHFFYLGKDQTSLSVTNPVIKDFSSQAGLLDQLKYDDFYTSTATVSVSGSSAYTEEMGLTRVVAFGHFELIFPEGVAYTNEDVTISGDGIYNRVSIDMQNNVTFTKGDPATITVPGRRDFYITLLPKAGEPLAPEFRVQIGDKYYKGSLPASDLQPSSFIRKSHGIGWPVTMAEYDPDEEPWTDPYPDEDARNPLHKFAKNNLTATGDVTNDFAADNDNGALYQWGRNHGFMDISRGHGTIESSTDYINWEDAFGDLEQPTSGGQRYWDFYVYSQRGETYYTGTGGVKLDPYSYWSPIIFDESKTYNSIEDLKAHPTKWFMDGRYDQGSYVGNLGGYLFSTCNPDYWVWSGGGDTWSERAPLCGYDENPCPAGWRMPTKEDFEAIAPYESINDQASLESLLRNHAEVRQTKDGIRYAIRWLYRPTYLEIQAIIVSSDFLPSQTSDIVWENNPDVVVRKFPYTGSIAAYGGYDGIDGVDMAYPYHPGVPDAGVYSCVQIGVGGNIGPGMAGYWMEDKGYVFKFTASEITGAKTSYVKIETANPVTGYAIRPVMAK